MQEINALKQMGETHGKAQKQAMQRAEEILQKYKRIASISQNVLRVRVCFWSLLCFTATITDWIYGMNEAKETLDQSYTTICYVSKQGDFPKNVCVLFLRESSLRAG